MPIAHLGLNVRDMDEATAWYTAALGPLGYKVAMTFADGQVKGLQAGRFCGPDLWLAGPAAPTADGSDARHAGTGSSAPARGAAAVRRNATGDLHLAFTACSRAQVRAFHEAALCIPPPLPPPLLPRCLGLLLTARQKGRRNLQRPPRRPPRVLCDLLRRLRQGPRGAQHRGRLRAAGSVGRAVQRAGSRWSRRCRARRCCCAGWRSFLAGRWRVGLDLSLGGFALL